MRELRKLAVQKELHRFAPDTAPLFEDAIIHPALELEEDRRVGIVIIETQSELKSVFVAVNGAPVELQGIRIEVQAVDGIGVIWFADAVLVQLQVRADEFPHLEGDLFVNDVLLLEARCLK